MKKRLTLGLAASALAAAMLPVPALGAFDSFLGRDFIVTTSEGCVGNAHVGLGSPWGRHENPGEAIREVDLGPDCGHVVSIVPK